ncbi:benzoate 1,2-dioxygenase electron transfer component BenC [Marinobacter algicola]|uniref:benzoate 1,2-dioxygenase electron transfer component BenC n=1 Tax=Marinobacter algicola TaxID=236100 RepID=UPI003BA9325C
MSYTIALNFEDDVTRFIHCDAGETVLDAAYRQKVNLPMDCSDGVCGTCKGLCEQGAFELGDDYLEEALSEEEAAEGRVLTCQMIPSSDCVIRVPGSSALCKTQMAQFDAVVGGVESLSDSTIELVVTLEENAEPLTFLPGQYIKIGVPGTAESRSYSFSSRSGQQSASFLVRNIEGGLMSRYLTQACQAGQALTLTGPVGSFYLREIQRPVLFLAGGTGLAPFLAMLATLAQTGCDYPLHMVYGVNRDSDLVKLDALDEYAARIDNFTYTTCVVDEASNHTRKGYVTHHLSDAVLNQGDLDVYLCGPPPMVEAVRAYFSERGVTPAHVYYEKFTPSAAPGEEEDLA